MFTRFRRSLAAVALTIVGGALVAVPATPANADPVGYSFDYYRFCYEHNRAPATTGQTIYRGAQNVPGQGVWCYASVVPWRYAWNGGTFNRYYSWYTVCRMHGYAGVSSVGSNGYPLICRR